MGHIQDFSQGSALEEHWGYVARQIPCTKDAGTCAYLDATYHGHDVSMLYSFILWAVIVGILFLWALGGRLIRIDRATTVPSPKTTHQSAAYRLSRTIQAAIRRHLLPEAWPWVFGHTTRLQVLIFLILSGHLLVFTLVGITYKTWTTPISGSTQSNIRSGLGPWSDRIGVLAFALTPLSILLSSRESLLSLITGVPYHHFNFLHRWLGYVIYVQAALHTLGWTIVEGRLYQPQPTQWNSFIAQPYIIWGIVAMILLSFLVFHSTKRGIQLTGYEFFRKAHYVVAMVYIGACWAHWSHLYCWMLASLVVWFLDRGARLVRTFVLHHLNLPATTNSSQWGLHIPHASIQLHANPDDGDILRLDFHHNHDPWQIGQHFFLCFPQLSVFQAHPLTPCSVPDTLPTGQPHTYIIRARKGLTRELAQTARTQPPPQPGASETTTMTSAGPTTPVILCGPYGQSITETRDGVSTTSNSNLLCIAGGTGITFVLPPILQLISQPASPTSSDHLIELVWIIRRQADMQWIAPELEILQRVASSAAHNLRVRIFVTRETGPAEKEVDAADPPGLEEKSPCCGDADLPFTVHYAGPETTTATSHPDLDLQVAEFLDRVVQGPTRVLASGPAGIISTLRRAVARHNRPGKVWRGEERWDVELVHDDRVEW
ncbi:ferric reductase family protein [Aspergillus homomorphus CBS 101889]|uniref:Ferric-chelate reductase n=1 Tax=Aspergillus homomorphus (strain CBS 101889) TaxID=1450537 RepID=A0A395IC98_ASPHC|nr:ferric-chelate reductase [Aspergillus homomorphus CBS 101889]RAL15794.1 ferric-chelate reductase [Aspergillus homomorphus CBS 101889]